MELPSTEVNGIQVRKTVTWQISQAGRQVVWTTPCGRRDATQLKGLDGRWSPYAPMNV